jgi:hypothetical protein
MTTLSPLKMPQAARALESTKQTSEAVLSDASNAMSKAAENPKKATADLLHTPFMRAALPFINGGLAGMTATSVIQPVDMIKVRLQLAGEGIKTGPKPTPVTVFKDILAQGKVMDLYTGLSAGLLRQAVYTTARIGFFDTFMKSLTASAEQKGTAIGFKERAGAGLAAGGLAHSHAIRWPETRWPTRKLHIRHRRFIPNLKIRRRAAFMGRRVSHRCTRHGSQLWPTSVLQRSQESVKDHEYVESHTNTHGVGGSGLFRKFPELTV